MQDREIKHSSEYLYERGERRCEHRSPLFDTPWHPNIAQAWSYDPLWQEVNGNISSLLFEIEINNETSSLYLYEARNIHLSCPDTYSIKDAYNLQFWFKNPHGKLPFQD